MFGSNDAWRQHPWLKAKHNIRYMFPGLGTAVAIFSVYLVGEHFYKKLDSSSKSHH